MGSFSCTCASCIMAIDCCIELCTKSLAQNSANFNRSIRSLFLVKLFLVCITIRFPHQMCVFLSLSLGFVAQCESRPNKMFLNQTSSQTMHFLIIAFQFSCFFVSIFLSNNRFFFTLSRPESDMFENILLQKYKFQ